MPSAKLPAPWPGTGTNDRSAQYAEQPDLLNRRGKPAVVEDAQQIEQGGSAKDTKDCGAPARLRDGFGQRKDERNADDKHEERKDQIFEVKPGPGFMFELIGEQLDRTGVGNFSQA
jgi:hypothetical protein